MTVFFPQLHTGGQSPGFAYGNSVKAILLRLSKKAKAALLKQVGKQETMVYPGGLRDTIPMGTAMQIKQGAMGMKTAIMRDVCKTPALSSPLYTAGR